MTSENIVSLMTEKGIPRQEAHEFVRKASMNARNGEIKLRESLLNLGVEKYISREELDTAMDPRNFIGNSVQICNNAIDHGKKDLKKLEEWKKSGIKSE